MNVSLVPVTQDDAARIFAWRNDPWLVSLSSSRRPVAWEEHQAWLERLLAGGDSLFFIIEAPTAAGRGGVGTVRLDRRDDRQAVISIYLLREFTRRGYGGQALAAACAAGFAHWPIHEIAACVREDNPDSVAAFVKSGFLPVQEGPCPVCPPAHHRLLRARPDAPERPTEGACL